MSVALLRAFAEQVLALATSDRGHYRRVELIEQAARECLGSLPPPPGEVAPVGDGKGFAQAEAEGLIPAEIAGDADGG